MGDHSFSLNNKSVLKATTDPGIYSIILLSKSIRLKDWKTGRLYLLLHNLNTLVSLKCFSFIIGMIIPKLNVILQITPFNSDFIVGTITVILPKIALANVSLSHSHSFGGTPPGHTYT